MLLGLCLAVPAQAGLFSDEDARKQIQDNRKETEQLEAKLLKLENRIDQQTKSMLDLQGQIETLNGEIRKLRGQNEELQHGLQDAEKRAKDFYVDLDTRLRQFESAENAARGEAAPAGGAAPAAGAAAATDSFDPAVENRAFEAAYGLFRNDDHPKAVQAFRDFLKKYPNSVHVPNAIYWMGASKFALKDYKGAMGFYQKILEISPATPRAPDALLGIAGCQQELKQKSAAKKTLKQLVAQYPASEAAAKAKKLLASAK
jgi:tol-pal system protein YbgF